MVLEEKRLPTKEDLDEIISDRPVFVIRTCAHIGIANSKAIAISEVDEATEVPFGGEIRKNPDGSLQGIYTERALGLIMNTIPAFTFDEYKNMIYSTLDHSNLMIISEKKRNEINLLRNYSVMNRKSGNF